jgi:hypothetical protein
VWKIAHRTELVDWVRDEPAADLPGGVDDVPAGRPRAARLELPPRGDEAAMSKVVPEQVADRLAIMDVLNRYARGIDRRDLAVLKSVWWTMHWSITARAMHRRWAGRKACCPRSAPCAARSIPRQHADRYRRR